MPVDILIDFINQIPSLGFRVFKSCNCQHPPFSYKMLAAQFVLHGGLKYMQEDAIIHPVLEQSSRIVSQHIGPFDQPRNFVDDATRTKRNRQYLSKEWSVENYGFLHDYFWKFAIVFDANAFSLKGNEEPICLARRCNFHDSQHHYLCYLLRYCSVCLFLKLIRFSIVLHDSYSSCYSQWVFSWLLHLQRPTINRSLLFSLWHFKLLAPLSKNINHNLQNWFIIPIQHS